MDISELRKMSAEQLGEELVALRREQFNLRMQSATGEMPRHTEHGRVRKNIARIKTILAEQKRSGEK